MAVAAQRPLILASASPRRKLILEQLGLNFRIMPSGFDEKLLPEETPEVHVERLARGKTAEVVSAIAAEAESTCVLGADTVVVVDGRILGKPRDDAHALEMILSLAGRTHRVLTGVALHVPGRTCESGVFTTEVQFRALSRESARAYVASGEGRDAAGAYAIQGLGTGLVTRITGSYTNVVGLPAADTLDLLLRGGVVGGWP